MPEKFYVTTPIYYVNARPHIGHAYTTIAADVLARRARMAGQDTWFLTGTDEHGQKIERSAAAASIPPKEFADQVSAAFLALWQRMGISFDQYIRTTDPDHGRGVQHLFTSLYDRGHIYLDQYTGQYCVSEEMFVDGPPGTIGPDGRPTETVTEENFYFRLSAFQKPLLDLIESNQLAIEPESRKNEVLSFLRGNVSEGTETLLSDTGIAYIPGALKDLSVSRTSFDWGIPVPEPAASNTTQKHVIYVWLDALANYMTAVGYGDPSEEAAERFRRFWPADLHLVGKEIVRFHCVYWPAFLLAAGLPLPRKIVAHGWLLFEESKMSKSRGNIVRTETILDAFGTLRPDLDKPQQDLFAADVLRYFLLREIPFGQDGSFSFDALVARYNSDLANGYGNLVSRTLKAIKAFSQSVPSPFPADWTEQDENDYQTADSTESADRSAGSDDLQDHQSVEYLELQSAKMNEDVEAGLDRQDFVLALKSVTTYIAKVDGFLTRIEPWKKIRATSTRSQQRKALEAFNATLAAIRVITAKLFPFMPYAAKSVWQQLGLGDITEAATNGSLVQVKFEFLPIGLSFGSSLISVNSDAKTSLFPRADKELIQRMSDMEQPTPAPLSADPNIDTQRLAPMTEATSDVLQPAVPTAIAEPTSPSPSEAAAAEAIPDPSKPTKPDTPEITIDDFLKVDLRVARVLTAERIPKADKLLRLQVDLGYEQRQILAGIAQFYEPETLVGRKVVIVANLAPRKLRGLESQGMIVAASIGDGTPALAGFLEDIEIGARLR